jgi:ubiquitin-activating enzyme E1
MQRMAKASVLVSGLGGLGVEIAKNLILYGFKAVTIHDTQPATILDLSSQFYLSESDIGKNRALASVDKLAELNHSVSVTASSQPITPEFLSKFNTVVFTEALPESKLISWNHYCRENHIAFILCEAYGVFGFVFTDFGNEFVVSDPTGEQRSRFQIELISSGNPGIVTCPEGVKHNMNFGDLVSFEEVPGMVELNSGTYAVTPIRYDTFSIGDTTSFHPYELFTGSGGYGTQIVTPKVLNFVPYDVALQGLAESERVILFDSANWGRDSEVVLAFATMHRLMDTPNGISGASAESIVQTANEINGSLTVAGAVNETLLGLLARQWGLTISPMASVLGGIVGQEVLKSVSGKLTPIRQSESPTQRRSRHRIAHPAQRSL